MTHAFCPTLSFDPKGLSLSLGPVHIVKDFDCIKLDAIERVEFKTELKFSY